MIVLDTQSWVWWTNNPARLSGTQRQAIRSNEADTIGVSVISCWEIAKLYEYGRLELPVEISEWFDVALAYSGISLLNLTPGIAIESTRLPGDFHRDPFDQMIVATARLYGCPLVTTDRQILRYEHVQTVQ